jgi:hypothetical protein
MKQTIASLGLASLMAVAASAGTIDSSTTHFTVNFSVLAGCVHHSTASVTSGGSTLTYKTESRNNDMTPNIIHLRNLVSTGSGTSVSARGLRAVLNANFTIQGSADTLPNDSVYERSPPTSRGRPSNSA